MLTSDAAFLLNEFLKPAELTNTVRALRSDDQIKSRSYTVATGTLTIFNVVKMLFKPTNHYQMLAKGLVIHENANGEFELACVPLTKFYNLFESVAQSDLAKAIEEGMKVYPAKKHDGTLINRFVWDGKVYFATRSVILNLDNSDLESQGEEFAPSKFLKQIENLRTSANENLFSGRYYETGTMSFELVGPENIILEEYEEPALLYISRTEHTTLEQFFSPDIELAWSILSDYDGSFPANLTVEKSERLLALKTPKIVEGYILIVVDTLGRVRYRFKVKTPEYLNILKLKNYVSKSVISDNYAENRYKTFDDFSAWVVTQFDSQAILYAEELLERYKNLWDYHNFQEHFSKVEQEFESLRVWSLEELTTLEPRQQYELAGQMYPRYRGVAVNIARQKSLDKAFLSFYKIVTNT